MAIFDDSNDLDEPLHDPENLRRRSPLFIFIAAVAALCVTAALLGGYYYLRRKHAAETLARQQQEQQQQQQQSGTAKPVASPEVKIYENQAMPKGAQVLIGGTVQNISGAPLADLSVELELTRRADNSAETRTLALAPKDLAPDEQGRYSLTVLSRDYKRARILRVKSGARSNEVAFTTAPGTQRPPGPSQQTPKTIIVNRPPPRSSNSDFINTPDNPTKVP